MNGSNFSDKHSNLSLIFQRISAFSAAVAVALGAFGAHAMKDSLLASGMTETWKTASLYHITHSIALFALARTGIINRGPAWLLVVGIVLFSGSLYLLALTGWGWLGPVTPLGGSSFIIAWIWLAVSAGQIRSFESRH